jgi:hypothetical protein
VSGVEQMNSEKAVDIHVAWLRGPRVYIFVGAVALGGVHLLEHIVQLIQLYALRMPSSTAHGIAGSFADLEPVHFAYNLAYLALLLMLWPDKLPLGQPERRAALFVRAATVFQLWHMLEHAVKIAQYMSLGIDGTGGILGAAPGGLLPVFSVPLLHFTYNLCVYVPILFAAAQFGPVRPLPLIRPSPRRRLGPSDARRRL